MVRFREISLANWAFRNVPLETWGSIPLYGYRLHLNLKRSLAQQLLYLMGQRMIEEQSLVARYVKPNMRVVDVGANIGYYLLLLEHLIGKNGHAICIEPNPVNLPELQKNIEINQFNNVILHEVALGATTGEAFSRTGINGGITNDAEQGERVTIEPLDKLVQEQIDFIKIDVDGYEAKVLEGCEKTLHRDHPVLLLEMHPTLLPEQDSNCAEIYQFLKTIYTDIKAFETKRPHQESMFEKIRNRYIQGSAICKIKDVNQLIQAADNGEHDWTFWLVCR